MKLNNKTLGQLPAPVQRPTYDRSKVVPSIVHLGLGAFHRAHQAVYTEAVLASGDLGWGIVGAGMVSDHMKQALQPQDGLFTLIERGAGHEKAQVIGAIVELLGPPGDLPRLLKVMSAPSTRIVSLTVTEKGYYLDPATGALQIDAPAIAQDLAQPQQPRTILGLIVEALRQRRAAGVPAFTVLSCDNLANNGKRAKAAVLAYAARLDADLADWIASNASFPCTMVDRITPATTDADRAYLADKYGVDDAWPVVTEQFTQWVIEDRFTMGRPDWTLGGACFSNEIETWENMKLRCLNGSHSTLAYLGQLTGRETVFEAMQLPLISDTLDALWAEVCAVLQAPQGVDPADYVDNLKLRFRNPAIQHKTAQIAMDGSQKLPQRLLASLRERIARGLPSPTLCTAVAAWMHFVVKKAHTPDAVLSDPLAADLLARARSRTDAAGIVDALLAVQPVFGTDLPLNADVRAAVLDGFRQLARHPDVACASQIQY